MVRRRLAGRIWRARIVAGLLGEATVVRQGTVNFIRRDMQEPKALRARAKLAPMCERDLKHNVSAEDIGTDEFSRTVDRSVNMTLCRQMHDCVRLETRKDVGNGRTITNIRAAEVIPWVALYRSK